MPECEFFACRREEIDDKLVEEGPHDRFDSVEAKSIDQVEVSSLGAVLGAGSYDELITKVMDGPEAESGESGVFTVPSEIRDALAACSDLDSAAERWAATEEMRLDRWTAAQSRELLDVLAALARASKEDGRQLWVWWSL